ncbi:MAG TPA: hypothetical protein DCM28_15260 [Phycisphaerales bacterium]|nr:hypothetical protein [Phycisphaerales bacterium]HCD35297.1 hypothetical protein [Phycisphaerales bacterium]|tara:strand:- start:2562 stop:3446 length:885 start_codon:yes stop_codon:yes gene_type:complete
MNNNMPCLENTAAVMVSYHPDDDWCLNAKAVLEQLDRLYIVDNGSDQITLSKLNDFASRDSRVLVLSNNINMGIAVALNQGCQLAIQEGYHWLLCLDQDSLLKTDWLVTMQKIFNKHMSCQSIGVIGVNFEYPDGRVAFSFNDKDVVACKVKTVITSGSLLQLSVWQDVGPFPEHYFIDLVDHEYALRLANFGYLVLMSIRPLIRHRLGLEKAISCIWLVFRPSNHNPTRRYYIARNRVLLTRTYWKSHPGFIFNQWWRQAREVLGYLLLESNKSKKFCGTLKGIASGLFFKSN